MHPVLALRNPIYLRVRINTGAHGVSEGGPARLSPALTAAHEKKGDERGDDEKGRVFTRRRLDGLRRAKAGPAYRIRVQSAHAREP